MAEVPGRGPDATGGVLRGLLRKKKVPGIAAGPSQGFQALSSTTSSLRLGDQGAGFHTLGGGPNTTESGFATLSSADSVGAAPGPTNPSSLAADATTQRPDDRKPRKRRRDRKSPGTHEGDQVVQAGVRGDGAANVDQTPDKQSTRTGTTASPDHAGTTSGNIGSSGGDGRGPLDRTTLGGLDPEEGPNGKPDGEDGELTTRSIHTRRTPGRRERLPDHAGDGQGSPDEPEEVIEVTIEADEGKPDRVLTPAGEQALQQMRDRRRELGLPASRLVDDPRWQDAFKAAYVPPDVPDGDPAALPRGEVQRWFKENEDRVQEAINAAHQALTPEEVLAYHRYGEPHPNNPEQDPTVRIILHLDQPQGPHTPEGDPAVKDTLVAEQPSGDMRVKRRPTLTDLDQPDVTVSQEDIDRFRNLFPEKAAVYEDYLAKLEAQVIHEGKAYNKYPPEPGTDTTLVSDPVLVQMNQAWQDLHQGARPAHLVDPQPEGQREPSIRATVYRRATERYGRRARRTMNPYRERGNLRYNPRTQRWELKSKRTHATEHWRRGHEIFREEVLQHDPNAHAAKRPRTQRSRLYERTGRTGFRHGFRRVRPVNLYNETDYAELGHRVERGIRRRHLKSEDGTLGARDVFQAKKDVRRARRARRNFRNALLNDVHEEIFPMSRHTAQRPYQRPRVEGNPRHRPTFESRPQRARRRRALAIQRAREFQANQRRFHEARARQLALERQTRKIEQELHETSLIHFITRGKLHSELILVRQELRQVRAQAFRYHPAVRGIAKGLELAGARFALAA